MNARRLSTSRDYLAMLVRRKWIIIFTFAGLAGIALVAVSIIPNMYVSESLILYQPSAVSSELVKEISNRSTEESNTTIQETILSRSNLALVAKEFEKGLASYRGLSDDKKAEKMRGRLKVDIVAEKAGNADAPVTHVRVKFKDEHPELAQKIAARITSLFVAQDNRTRSGQVYGTAAFLATELSKVTARLTQSSDNLKAVKERYHDQLPSQYEANLRTLDRLEQEKTANLEALDRQKTLKLNIDRQLSETPVKITDVSAMPGGIMRERNPLIDAYLRKNQEYQELEAKATDRHPDVIRLRAELDRLRKSIPPEDFESIKPPDRAVPGIKMAPNPLYQNLVAQLNQVNTEIDIRQREREAIEKEAARINAKIQNTPRAEQEISAIDRNHADLMKQADDLRARLDQAKLAESVEVKRQHAQFVVIDEANLPLEPESPNRSAAQLSSLAACLGLAFLVGTAVDLSQRKVFTSTELERIITAKILVEIPKLEFRSKQFSLLNVRMKYAGIVLLCVGGAYAWVLYRLYSHPSFLLKVLDPLIQKMQG